MIAPVLTAPPARALVDVRTAREHLRLSSTDEDWLVSELIQAAYQYLDGWGGILGRCIEPQTWRTTSAGFSSCDLPFPDVQDVVVKYLDPAGVEQTLATSAYRFGNDGSGAGAASAYVAFDPGFSFPAIADRSDAVRIDGTYGFPPGTNIRGIKAAMLMLIAYWFDVRDGSAAMPPAVCALLAPFRQVTF